MSIFTAVQAIRPGTSNDLIQLYLPVVESISACLDGFGEDLSDLTKALVIAHFAEQSTVSGTITAESTRTGASASYKALTGTGLASTRFGQQLLNLPTLACVQSLVKSNQFARSINRVDR